MPHTFAPATVFVSALALAFAAQGSTPQGEGSIYPDMPAGTPPRVANPDAEAKGEADMKRYVEAISGSEVTFALVPIKGGRFAMGSAESEAERKSDEGPRHDVEIAPFWIEEHELTWDEYRLFQSKLELEAHKSGTASAAPNDAWADAVSRPTPPYVPMDFGMGIEGCPAVCMTAFAAKHYTKWLSMKTGRFYRLPTEAEWEYACRAGTTTRFSFGDDAAKLGEYAWYFDNADGRYQKIMQKKPNPWGLYDMHGNVAEWVVDQLDTDFYARSKDALASNPIKWPSKLDPRVVRGGSWDDDAERLRSAARRGSSPSWKVQDPQLPKSIWWLTDAKFVGFRVVRPLAEPSAADQAKFWDADLDSVNEVLARQRKGGR